MARSTLVLVVLVASCLALANAANIWDQLGTSGFTGLRTALNATGLAGMFNTTATTPKYTVFAPNDAAFAAAASALMTLNGTQIAAILAFHVVSGDVRSSAIMNDMVVLDTAGKAKRFNIYGTAPNQKYTINGIVNIVLSGVDIVCDNGVIHTIDKIIMIPTDDESRTITAEVVANPTFATLRTALTTASLANVFANETDPYTVFAPTDAAFAKLGGLVAELLKPANLATLQAILKYHVVAGTVYSTALSNNMMVTTLQTGVTATISIAGSVVKIDNSTIAPADLTRRNGVIHVIDTVLVPSNVQLPTITPTTSNPPPMTPEDSSASALVAGFAAVAIAVASLL